MSTIYNARYYLVWPTKGWRSSFKTFFGSSYTAEKVSIISAVSVTALKIRDAWVWFAPFIKPEPYAQNGLSELLMAKES